MPIARQRLVADAVRATVALAPREPLSGLPRAEREAVALARFAGLTTEDIAAAVGVETAIVKSRLRDGLGAIGRATYTVGTPCAGWHAACDVRAADPTDSARNRSFSSMRRGDPDRLTDDQALGDSPLAPARIS
jgi:Sigma-70, region 4